MPRVTTHFWPFTQVFNADTGMGTIFPWAFKAEQLFRWHYLCREWKLDTDGTSAATSTDGGVSVSVADYTADELTMKGDLDIHPNPLEEMALTCKKNSMRKTQFKQKFSGAGQAVANLNYFNTFYPAYYTIKDGLYYPRIQILVVVRGSTGSSDTNYWATTESSFNPDDPLVGTCAVTIDGLIQDANGDALTLNKYEVANYNTGSGESSSASISSVSLTPSKFWTHDDGTGPAYNELTGEYLL